MTYEVYEDKKTAPLDGREILIFCPALSIGWVHAKFDRQKEAWISAWGGQVIAPPFNEWTHLPPDPRKL